MADASIRAVQLDDLVLGLIAAPGLPEEVARELARDLPERLAGRFPEVRWVVRVARGDPAPTGARGMELVHDARRLLVEECWDLAICITDVPLATGARPEVARVSTTHGVGVMSLPALGAMHLARRAERAVLRIIDGLLGEGPGEGDADRRAARVRTRLRELAVPAGRTEIDDDDDGTVRFVAAVVRGNFRLLVGMIRHNRPWRLAARLSRAMAAALAAAALALVTSDIWRISAALSPARLALIMLAAIGVTAASLIAAHDLWEPYPGRGARRQVVLFNIGTAATVLIGVLTLYAGLLLVVAPTALLLIDPDALKDALGHDVHAGDYAGLTWLVASLATVGGALGAALETDLAVREAAYALRLAPGSPQEREGGTDERAARAADADRAPGGP
jgi:hypothetical protein